MNARRLTILSLLVAVLLLLMLLIWSRENRASIAPTAALPVAKRLPITASLSSAAARGSSDFRAAQEIHAGLRRLLAGRDARPNEAVLTFADADAYRRFLARAQHAGLAVVGQLDPLLSVRVRYDSLAALEADLLKNAGDYADVAANSFIRIPEKPPQTERAAVDAVPFRNETLGFLGVAGDHSTWGRGITIAILDTGIAPDATFGISRVRYSNIGLGTLPGTGSEDGHGTSVAALAAGVAADAPGVAPSASLLSIRVTDADGTSDIFTVAQAIIAAVDAGAPIINLSLGGYTTTAALNSAIDYASAHGAVIVAAAGNDQAAQLSWPAADPRVVSVGAVDALGQQVAFSNSGPQLQITAPGYGVQTAWLDGQRVYVDGTSASAPLVAGAIAAVMSQNPGLTANQAWDIVRQTASDAGAPGADPDYGNGVLNLDWAMNRADPTRVDPAIASHYYDAANSQMDFVVQNRGAQTVTGLALDVDTNGFTKTYRLPEIVAGASYTLLVPVDQKTLLASNGLTFTTQLVTPFGLTDANVANNRRTSRLVPNTK